MIEIKGIDHVAINVRDINKSVEFYTKVVGLKITEREPSKPGIEVFLDCGPRALIGIIQADNTNDVHLFKDEGLGANHFSFQVHAKDFDPMIKRLEDNNTKIGFAKKRSKSWSLYFFDIDGNKVEVTAWPLEDGLPKEKIKKEIYDPKTKIWSPYE
ncbi:MAG TPA: VOC family protein [Candidatus Omnitrophota bacterium]|nr:VOC family protein [Candidatus Omnitrophota bacterium]